MRIPATVWLGLAMLLVPVGGDAQTVRGRIIADVNDQPIRQAQVSVLAADRDVILGSSSATDGSFLIHLREAGTYRLRVEALGYRSLTTAPVAVPATSVITLELRLARDAIVLDPLRIVTLRREPPFMQDVRRRHSRGFGRLITREQLDERLGSRLQDVLRDTGLWITEMGTDSGPLTPLVTARLRGLPGGRSCFADLYLNGVRQYGVEQDPQDSWPRVQELFQFRPTDIEAIEIYRGAAEVPAEYSGSSAQCGVVAMWLRSGYEYEPREAADVPLPPVRARAGVRSVMMRIEGTYAPDPAMVLEAAFAVAGTPRLTFSVHTRYGRHVLAPETVWRLTRPVPDADEQAGAQPMSLFAAGAEPLLVLFQVGPVRPVVAVRAQFVHRRFSLPSRGPGDSDRTYSSSGWAGGVSGGVEFDLSRRLVAEMMYGWEWSRLGAFPQLETYWRRTDEEWNAALLRMGVALRL